MPVMSLRLSSAILACALTLPMMASAGDDQAPVVTRFDVSAYAVDGNTLLPEARIRQVLKAFTGKSRDFNDVQKALEALQAAYSAAGYGAVQVYLPEQELRDGVVRLAVVETRLGEVSVSGNRHFDEANVLRSLPALRPGQAPSAPRIADNTRLANENAARKLRVVLRPSEREGLVDAVVEVQDERPLKVFASLDNTGSPSTGEMRAGLGVLHSNLFNRDHTLSAQYLTSPTQPRQVSIYSLGYNLPLYGLGHSIDLIAGYSDVDAGTTQTQAGPLSFSGRGSVLLGRYNLLLPRMGEYEHRIILGADYRAYENVCSVGTLGSAGCGVAGADVAVQPVSVTYAGTRTGPASVWSLGATLLHNIPGGHRAAEADLRTARPGARGDYTVARANASLALAGPRDLQLRLRVSGQYTADALVPGEQFGMGGWNSVRGFLEREAASDIGYVASAELHSPNLATLTGGSWGELRLLLFYDAGQVARRNPQPGDRRQIQFSSAGGGVRLALGRSASLRADLAYVTEGDGVRADPGVRGHVGLVINF